jgi:hypothetical protein
VRAALALAFVFQLGLGSAAAQRPRLEVTLPPQERLAVEGPQVRATGVLGDPAIRQLLDAGFPARLHFRVERWSAGGFFNSLLGRSEWDIVVRFDPLTRRYRVVRIQDDRVVAFAQVESFGAAVSEVERPLPAPIRATPHPDRQYYIVVLEVETLSVNDLDELERWLRGEMGPALRGEGSPGTALGRGLRQLLVRLIGSERRSLKARSPTFLMLPQAR